MEIIQYERLRPQQLIDMRNKTPVVYVPLGPLEWHGPHLPYGVDVLHAYTLATEACRLTGGVVLPPLALGTETFLSEQRVKERGFKGSERIIGMDFPAFPLPSLYNEESAFGVIVRDLVIALKRQMYKVIAIVNGHGGRYHMVALDRIAWETSEPPEVQVMHIYSLNIKIGGERQGGHAEKGETSFMLKYFPETVDLNALPKPGIALKNADFGVLDGPTCQGEPTPDFTVRDNQDPRHASAEEGEKNTKERVQFIATTVRNALAESRSAHR